MMQDLLPFVELSEEFCPILGLVSIDQLKNPPSGSSINIEMDESDNET